MKKIKILYLIDKFGLAGAQKHLSEVISGLDKAKFEPTLVTLEELGIKRIYGISGIKGLFKLIRIIRQNNFDIVQSYLFSENILGIIAAKLAGVRIIITGRRDTGMLREGRWQHILAYRLTNRWVDKIICVSEAVKKITLRKEKVNPDKVLVIYNGVDVDKFQVISGQLQLKEALNIKEKEFVVGMIANFSWIKGHKELIGAAKIVLSEISNIKFLLIGDGPQRQRIAYSVERLGLKDKVLFLGKRQDIPELLSIMDVSVNASYSEGMSNTILESMAIGVPVVATAVDGNLETVVDGLTGILVPPRSPQAIAEAIMKVLKDKELAREMSRNSQELIKAKFTSQIMLDNMEKLYTGLLTSKVVFIFSQFPCYDETFILREMVTLKKQGLSFIIFSLKTPKDKIVHCDAKDLIGDTIYLPFISIKVILAQVYFLLRNPVKYLGTLLYIMRINLKSKDFFLKSLALFPKSVYMAQILKKGNVRHIHGQWATHPTTSAMIISWLIGVPFSFTGHAHDIYVNTVGLKEKIKQAKFVTTCTQYNQGYLLNLVNGQLKGRLNNLKEKIITIYHGVDLEKFRKEGQGLNGKYTILSVGSLLEAKGFDVLIKACRVLLDKRMDFKCIIAGGGPLQPQLQLLVSGYKLSDRIQFTGYISQDNLIPLYKQADVFALPVKPSIHWGIPNVLLEAMAARLPVICTNLPSLPEVIQNNRTGFVVGKNNPAELADTLRRLSDDKNLREEVGNAGHKIIEEKFNLKKNITQLTELFAN